MKLTERQQLEVLIEWLRHGERSGYDWRAPTKASTRSGLHNEPHFRLRRRWSAAFCSRALSESAEQPERYVTELSEDMGNTFAVTRG